MTNKDKTGLLGFIKRGLNLFEQQTPEEKTSFVRKSTEEDKTAEKNIWKNVDSIENILKGATIIDGSTKSRDVMKVGVEAEITYVIDDLNLVQERSKRNIERQINGLNPYEDKSQDHVPIEARGDNAARAWSAGRLADPEKDVIPEEFAGKSYHLENTAAKKAGLRDFTRVDVEPNGKANLGSRTVLKEVTGKDGNNELKGEVKNVTFSSQEVISSPRNPISATRWLNGIRGNLRKKAQDYGLLEISTDTKPHDEVMTNSVHFNFSLMADVVVGGKNDPSVTEQKFKVNLLEKDGLEFALKVRELRSENMPESEILDYATPPKEYSKEERAKIKVEDFVYKKPFGEKYSKEEQAKLDAGAVELVKKEPSDLAIAIGHELNRHESEMFLVFAPTDNSFERFKGTVESPSDIAFDMKRQIGRFTANMFRMFGQSAERPESDQATRDKGGHPRIDLAPTRIEVRISSAEVDPHLAMETLTAAFKSGVKDYIENLLKKENNIEEGVKEYSLDKLLNESYRIPDSRHAALNRFEKSEISKQILGQEEQIEQMQVSGDEKSRGHTDTSRIKRAIETSEQLHQYQRAMGNAIIAGKENVDKWSFAERLAHEALEERSKAKGDSR